MAVGVYVGSFTKNIVTGNQDITLPAGCPDLTGAGAGTWAIQFWSTPAGNSVSGTWVGFLLAMVGFTTGAANSYSSSIISSDAVAASSTSRRMAAKCIAMANSNGTTWAEADFVSFPTSTTMRINWTTNQNDGGIVVCFAILTGLTNAKVLDWTTPTTSVPKSVTGAGFKPDLVIHASAFASTALPYNSTGILFCYGIMNKHGQQWANSVYGQHAVNPSNTSRWQQTDACILKVTTNENATTEGNFVSMDADGFTLNFSSSATAEHVISLCIGGVSSKIGGLVAPASTGSKSYTRSLFTPKGLLTSTVRSAPASNPVANVAWSLAVADVSNSRAAALIDNDAVTPTVVKSVWRNDRIFYAASNTLDYDAATLTSFDSDGFTVNWVSGSNGVEFLYCLISDAGVNTYPTTVGV